MYFLTHIRTLSNSFVQLGYINCWNVPLQLLPYPEARKTFQVFQEQRQGLRTYFISELIKATPGGAPSHTLRCGRKNQAGGQAIRIVVHRYKDKLVSINGRTEP